MITYQELSAFISVSKHLSFIRAARDVGTSAPHVSKIILQLERKLHRKLFLRTTRAVKLTKDGILFLDSAMKAVDSLKTTNDFFIIEKNEQLRGLIRITAPQTWANRVLSPLLAEFHKIYPNITFEFLLSEVYLSLIEENIDLAFRIMELGSSSLKGIKLESNPIIFCAHPLYLKKYRSILSIQDLRQHTLLAIPPHLNFRFKKSGKKLFRCVNETWLSSTNGDFLVEQAKLGQGLLVRSQWGVQRELDLGELVEVRLDDELVSPTDVYLLFQENFFMPQRVRIFIDFIKDKFKKVHRRA